jgi:hypothetical protein
VYLSLYSDWLEAERPVFCSQQRQVIFVSSRPAQSSQPPIQWVPRTLPSGEKHPRREADHWLLSIADVKKDWSYTSTTPYVFMAWSKYQRQLTFTFFIACHAIKWRNNGYYYETSTGSDKVTKEKLMMFKCVFGDQWVESHSQIKRRMKDLDRDYIQELINRSDIFKRWKLYPKKRF